MSKPPRISITDSVLLYAISSVRQQRFPLKQGNHSAIFGQLMITGNPLTGNYHHLGYRLKYFPLITKSLTGF